MPTRNARAMWQGSLVEGRGTLSLASTAYEGPYSFRSRFEEGPGTNPEELIGAAHAGCYSMALAGALGKAGYTPERVQTSAKVHLDKVGDGYKITRIELHAEAKVPGIDRKVFQEQVEVAAKGCPVSQALAGVDIRVEANLIS